MFLEKIMIESKLLTPYYRFSQGSKKRVGILRRYPKVILIKPNHTDPKPNKSMIIEHKTTQI